ncbi:weary [Carabus blaptoides fortunei]
MCELEPCVFGQCTLTAVSFRCHCQTGYTGGTCEQKQRPCEGNPCEGRGECIERADTYHCRCHAWWEGARCERRMMHIPYTPLSERMLHEPFWLGLITVTIVLAVIGLVWCARRHFPEKLEKLLAEESDRNRGGTSLRGSSVREQLSGGAAATAAVMVVPSPQPGCQRSLFGRLGIRKPSILSLTSPHGLNVNNHATAAAAARTFSLDDLLKPPPRRTPSPRKKRNNSTPTKKNAAEKKQILQQLISPSNQQRARKVSIGELIQLSERKLKEQGNSSELVNDIKETHLGENNVTSTAQITLTDPKLEKKVTFARLLNKVSQEMSSGSEVELGVLHTSNHQQKHSSGRTSTSAAGTTLRSASTPPSPATDMRSPNSTSSNQGSDSLSSSDLALATPSDLFSRKTGGGKLQMCRNKPASADSILAMFRNFSSTSVPMNMTASIRVSPSTTPTASTPQDDVAGDDESTTSSIHTPVSLDSPPTHRRHLLQSQHNHSTIEVPVLDALSAHKCNDGGSNFLHPPTILLEVPTSINKCLSPIREMPTPLPTPLPSPCLTPVLQRSAASSSAEDLGMDLSDDRISVELPCMSAGYSDDDDDDNNNNNDDEDLVHSLQDIAIDIQAEDGLIQEEAAVMQQTSSHATYKYKTRPPLLGQIATADSTASSSSSAFAVVPGDKLVGGDDSVTNCLSQPAPQTPVQQVPVPLIIPMLTIQQPSPTHTRPHLLTLPGSPPPHRSPVGIQECSNFYHHHHHHPTVMYGDKSSRRMLKDFDKPTSLDLPCAPPLITVTCNMSEAESDTESLSPLATKPCNPHVGSTSGTVAMCYLSPFSMCSRADRTASESNLSSSGYSSMASPGPSRCGSNNPLCPSEMEDPGAPGPNSATSIHHSQLPRRPSPLLKSNPSSAGGSTVDNDAGEQRGGHCRGRSDSETLSDDPMLESNDEGIGTDHIDEKIEEGELKSAKELEMYIGKDLTVLEDPLDALHIDRLLFPSAVGAAAPTAATAVVPVSSPVCKVSLLQLPSIVIEADPCDCGSMSVGSTLVGSLQQQQQHVSPVSSRSESPLSDRTVGIGGGCAASGIGAVALGRFSPHFYNKHKDLLPFTDSDGLYDFPSSDCTPQNKISVVSTMQQHRKSTGRKREKKSTRNALKSQSPTKSVVVATGTGSLHHQHHHHHHLDVPSGKESYYRVQTPRKPSPKRRARKEQILSSSSSSESLSSIREPKLSSSSPSPDTIRWPAPGPIAPLQHTIVSSGNSTSTSASASASASTVPPINAKWLDVSGSRRPTVLVHESSCEEDSADESFSVQSPSVADDGMNKQTRKISRLRTISHQIRFLRRLEKNLKRREHLTCPSDSIDSGDGEEDCRVTSPLLQPELGAKPQIRKSISIGLLPSGAATNNPSTRFKRGKMKKGSDLLIPQEDNTWTHVLTTGNGHSD